MEYTYQHFTQPIIYTVTFSFNQQGTCCCRIYNYFQKTFMELYKTCNSSQFHETLLTDSKSTLKYALCSCLNTKPGINMLISLIHFYVFVIIKPLCLILLTNNSENKMISARMDCFALNCSEHFQRCNEKRSHLFRRQ